MTQWIKEDGPQGRSFAAFCVIAARSPHFKYLDNDEVVGLHTLLLGLSKMVDKGVDMDKVWGGVLAYMAATDPQRPDPAKVRKGSDNDDAEAARLIMQALGVTTAILQKTQGHAP